MGRGSSPSPSTRRTRTQAALTPRGSTCGILENGWSALNDGAAMASMSKMQRRPYISHHASRPAEARHVVQEYLDFVMVDGAAAMANVRTIATPTDPDIRSRVLRFRLPKGDTRASSSR